MAIKWGPVDTNNQIQFGVDATTAPNHATGQAAVEVTLSVRRTTSGAVTISGTPSVTIGGTDYSLVYWSGPVSATQQTLGSQVKNVPMSYTGAQSVAYSGRISPYPLASSNVTIPIRYPALASAATAADATYVSDTRTDITWTRPANADADATIWSNVQVQRQAAWSAVWATVSPAIAGTATAWSDMSVASDTRYRYRVAGTNLAGVGAYRETGYISTTPAAPSSVTANRSDLDIVVAWTDNSFAENGFEIQDETTTVGSTAASTFTHLAPSPSDEHRYRVRAVVDGGRVSPWSTYSDPVVLLTAPAAPANLSPNGTVAPANETFRLSWVHVPIDTTAQTRREVNYRAVGAPAWIVLDATTSDQSLGFFSGAAVTYEWRVRTKGAHPDWSPWSATATFTTHSRPTATISSPAGDIPTFAVAAAWAYYQAAGQTQTGWQVEVVEAGAVIASATGSGTATTWTSPPVLTNLTTVTVRIRVRASSGLWSVWAESIHNVDFIPPAESLVTAEWQDGQGHVLMSVRAVDDGSSPATVGHRIERSTDGAWTVIADNMGTSVDLADWESPATGTFWYRVTAISASPSQVQTVVEVTVADIPANCSIWVSGGPGFTQAAKIVWNPATSADVGRDVTLNQYSGRRDPVGTSSRQVPLTVSVSADVLPTRYNEDASTVAELEAVFTLPGPVWLYRDPDGRVIYGALSSLPSARAAGGLTAISFSLTRSARGTDAQLATLPVTPSIVEVSPGVYMLVGVDSAESAPGVFEEIG